MTELRFPVVAAGADIGGEPHSWLVYDTVTKERRYEKNPNHVPPPPPTAIEEAGWAVREAEDEVARAQADLKYARAALAAARRAA